MPALHKIIDRNEITKHAEKGMSLKLNLKQSL